VKSEEDGMQLEMNVRDRMILEGLVPTQGNWLDMAIAEDIANKIKVPRKERQKLIDEQIVILVHGGGLDFDEDRLDETKKAVPFNEGEVRLLAKTLREKAEKDQLPRVAVKLYRVFVEGKSAVRKPGE